MDVVAELLTLPPWVVLEGVHFELLLFINGSKEIRLCYQISHVDTDSLHWAEYKLHQTWCNKRLCPNNPVSEGWLYLHLKYEL